MRWRTSRVILWAMRLLPLLLLAFPLVDFLRVVGGRLTYPFELEWMEGDCAIYAVRYVADPGMLKLYRGWDDGGYIPHIYPPFHQLLVAWWAMLTGSTVTLVQGRVISLIATFAAMLAMALIVHDSTRSRRAALIAALCYPMFFKATGYWYDLFRIDALGFGLALWSAYFFLKKNGGLRALCAGLLLAILAQATKQTTLMLVMPALCIRIAISAAQIVAKRHRVKQWLARRGWPHVPHRSPLVVGLFSNPKSTVFFLPILAIAFAAIVGLLFTEPFAYYRLYLYEMTGSFYIFYQRFPNSSFQEFWQYHLWLPVLIAAAAWSAGLLRKWRSVADLATALAFALLVTLFAGLLLFAIGKYMPAPGDPYYRLRGRLGPLSLPSILYIIAWVPPVVKFAAAVTSGGLALWVYRWCMHRTVVPGASWIATLLAVQLACLLAWAKMGGYINNLLPAFMVMSIVVGFCVVWLDRGLGRLFGTVGRCAGELLVLAILVLTWHGTRITALKLDPANTTFRRELTMTSSEDIAKLPWWVTDGLRYDRPAVTISKARAEALKITAPPLSPEQPDRLIIAHAQHLGGQLPNPKGVETGEKLLARIRELNADGGVYLPHQNFLAYMAGLKPDVSIDPYWNIGVLGKPMPAPLLDRFRKGAWKHIILMFEAPYEWMPPEVMKEIGANYEKKGDVVEGGTWPLRPVTGAGVLPMLLYDYKGPLRAESAVSGLLELPCRR